MNIAVLILFLIFYFLFYICVVARKDEKDIIYDILRYKNICLISLGENQVSFINRIHFPGNEINEVKEGIARSTLTKILIKSPLFHSVSKRATLFSTLFAISFHNPTEQ